MKLTLVPHTHWDREWYEPFEEFRRRLIPVVDQVLDLAAGGYPHFHLDGQTALVDDYLELRPEREKELREHAESGTVSLGPWLTLVDEFLVSGETMIRNLEIGWRAAERYGAAMPIGSRSPLASSMWRCAASPFTTWRTRNAWCARWRASPEAQSRSKTWSRANSVSARTIIIMSNVCAIRRTRARWRRPK